MPYGVNKKLGGDTKDNDAWIERCVNSVMKKAGKDKSSAIAICKAQLEKMGGNQAKAEVQIERLLDFQLYITDKTTRFEF